MKKRVFNMSLALSFLFLSVLAVQADEVVWEQEYTADEVPHNSTPKWVVNTRAQGAENIEDGQLHVNLVPGGSRYYTMGFYAGDKPAGDAAWNGSSGTSIIEFRVSSEAGLPEKEVFLLSLSDGTHRWDINFHSDAIRAGGKVANLNTSVADTYRVVLRNGLLQMSGETQGPIFDAIKGTTMPDNRNRIIFGTDARNNTEHLGDGSWKLDFLRWTNKTAD